MAQCMERARCITDKDLAFHTDCCDREGCTQEECGLTPIEEQCEVCWRPPVELYFTHLHVQSPRPGWEELIEGWRMVQD